MVDGIRVDERFREYTGAKIKHELKINVFQYIEPEAEYLDSNAVEKLDMVQKATQLLEKLGTLGFPMPPADFDMKKALTLMEAVSQSFGPTAPTVPIEAETTKPAPK